MHKRIVAAVLFALISVSYAKNVDLKGTIKKQNGDPVENSRITLKNNLSLTSFSDNNGVFNLKGVISDNLSADSLVVVTKGYKTVLEKVSEFEKTNMAIVLTTSNPWISNQPLQYRKGMVKINAKDHDFEMGQPSDTVRGKFLGEPTTTDEGPVHTVSFTYDFWMDTVEVCQGEYDSLMRMIYGTRYVKPAWNSSNGIGANFAAYAIEWASAALFCNARSKAEGLPDTAYSYSSIKGKLGDLCTLQTVSSNIHANAYRLPTEAEWEYAYRGGTTTDFYWEKDYNPYPQTSADTANAGEYAIFSYNSGSLPKNQKVGDSYYGINETARKKPNKYGLYDMAGNVSEWCNDWHDYYTWGAQTDPVGSTPADLTNYNRVRRGGNWGNQISYLRATNREFASPDYQYFFSGLRCVSSGISTGIKKGNRVYRESLPQIEFSSGIIHCSNVAGCEIGIYSLTGKAVYTAKSENNKLSIAVKGLRAGTYTVKVKSTTITNKTISILH